jgi:hypothetical protein
MDSGFDPAMVVFPISLASLVLVAVMERIPRIGVNGTDPTATCVLMHSIM